MLSLDAFSGVERVDAAAGTAVVGAGTRLGTLARELARHGLALANLGDIDQQTVAGAVATGTHGTGITIGSLSSQIVAMTIVDGTGRVRQLDADRAPELLRVARVGLGALGVITSITLKVQPAPLLVEREARRWRNCCAIWTRSCAQTATSSSSGSRATGSPTARR
jgi:FAD/FMN-containing dehydrogenase